ncbi:DUF4126 domain-containing protein [Hydrogenophaga sp.]|uniref:DUF4126 domain-containing protein n=1 Tax=Hydrogenophaga sp. TaxID=1904254 RepID=UPI0026342924|nr:DUF4126 domain-containing protein [Hydrogenophaga sp.]MDM7951008.1 DUF4126 domain-containing protein [Hydrogenophaga sp.]
METTDTNLWQQLVAWLHGMGLHLGGGPVADLGAQVGAGVANAASSMDMPSLLALAAALGWASGFRLYAVVFLVGAAGAAGWISLPPGLMVLQHPALLLASGFMLFMEFFADKIPGVDSVWDILNSVIRIPAGAALAAGALGADGATMALVGALLGGGLAATSQAAKTTTRAAINTSPEPFSNLAMSLLEDGLVVGAVWLATNHPVAFGVLLVIVVVLMWIVTWMLFKFLRAVIRRMSALLSAAPKEV